MAISDNQRDDNADTRQKNQPDSVISNGDWYQEQHRLNLSFLLKSSGPSKNRKTHAENTEFFLMKKERDHVPPNHSG